MPLPKNLKALGEIADIRTGYTFRGKIEEVPTSEANAHVAQIKDVRKIWEETSRSTLSAGNLPTIVWEGKDKAFVDPGSVLLPARGGYFRSSSLVQNANSDLPVVASSQFLVIHPKAGVLPEYLCWYLNQPAMQRNLTDSCQGTSIPMLNATAVKQLKIEVPSLETQHKILHLNAMWEQEQQLTQALLNNRETMLRGMFQQLLKEKNS